MDNNEEPEPRVGFKQASKRPTAADQFADYQNEYEARANSSVDGIHQVGEHSKTYPKRDEELDKRRSTAQVNCIHKKHREIKNDQRCSASKKTRRRKVNRLNETVKLRGARKKRTANGVRKSKRKKSQAAGTSGKRRGCVCALALEKKFRGGRLRISNKHSLSKLIGNTCCACKQVFRKALVCYDDASGRNKKELREIYRRGSRGSDRNSVDSKFSSKSKFIASPNSNRSSVTTYRSVGSISQEPMV